MKHFSDSLSTHRIGGAQDATMTLLAPASLAICTISFDVVPRTIESGRRKNSGLGFKEFDNFKRSTHHQLVIHSSD
jgi:hypothetical protein